MSFVLVAELAAHACETVGIHGVCKEPDLQRSIVKVRWQTAARSVQLKATFLRVLPQRNRVLRLKGPPTKSEIGPESTLGWPFRDGEPYELPKGSNLTRSWLFFSSIRK